MAGSGIGQEKPKMSLDHRAMPENKKVLQNTDRGKSKGQKGQVKELSTATAGTTEQQIKQHWIMIQSTEYVSTRAY